MRSDSMKAKAFVMTAAAFGFSGSAAAQHAGDILLSVIEGRIQTGAVLDSGEFDLDERVFISTLGVAFPDFADDPGFDCDPGTFPPNTSIGFRLTAALREWNGTDFVTIPDERVEIAFGPLGPIVTPMTDDTVEGFTIRVGNNGQWHRHLEYTLASPAESGVYLMEMTLHSTAAGIGESRPFWIVFNQNEPGPTVAAAAAWVVATKLCAADFNGDGFLDFFDYDDFVACFETGACGDSTADFNGDGFVDFFDYDDFVAAFEAGC
jgi:hypothetical protein